MRWLHFAPSHADHTSFVNKSLSDIHRFTISFRETERYVDLVLCSCSTDRFHLGTVDFQGVLDILNTKVEVNGTRPERSVLAKVA